MAADRPENLHTLFIAGVNAGDVDALLELYEPDAVSVGPDGRAIRGSGALRGFLEGFLARISRLEGANRKVVVAGDLALVSSTWRGVITTPDGRTVEASGTTAEVARRQPDGTWRLVIDYSRFTE